MGCEPLRTMDKDLQHEGEFQPFQSLYAVGDVTQYQTRCPEIRSFRKRVLPSGKRVLISNVLSEVIISVLQSCTPWKCTAGATHMTRETSKPAEEKLTRAYLMINLRPRPHFLVRA